MAEGSSLHLNASHNGNDYSFADKDREQRHPPFPDPVLASDAHPPHLFHSHLPSVPSESSVLNDPTDHNNPFPPEHPPSEKSVKRPHRSTLHALKSKLTRRSRSSASTGDEEPDYEKLNEGFDDGASERNSAFSTSDGIEIALPHKTKKSAIKKLFGRLAHRKRSRSIGSSSIGSGGDMRNDAASLNGELIRMEIEKVSADSSADCLLIENGISVPAPLSCDDVPIFSARPPAEQMPAMEEEAFLAVPANGNPRFPAGTSLTTPVNDVPPVVYSETVVMSDDGKNIIRYVTPQNERLMSNSVKSRKLAWLFVDGPLASYLPLLIMGGIAMAVMYTPMAPLMQGFLVGCIVTGTLTVKLWYTMFCPVTSRLRDEASDRPPPGLRKDPAVSLPGPSLISGDSSRRYIPPELSYSPFSQQESSKAEIFSTWMNQAVGDFHMDTYHVNQTQSVHVTLEGSVLRIRRPSERIVARRAMCDEQLKSRTVTFVEQHIFRLDDAQVLLIPEDIPRKRRWLWRFPIGIKLKDAESLKVLQNQTEEFEAKKAKMDEERGVNEEEREADMAPAKTEGEKKPGILYLVARSSREKEEWFWRLRGASGETPFPPLRPYISPYLNTLNAFMHRILFDVLTEPVWKDIIAQKIQKKLSVIGLPYFIDELKLVEIDLGKTLPRFGMFTARPGVDVRGIWTEVDVEYDGLVQLTLSTKLNLMKLKDEHLDDSIGPYRAQQPRPGQTYREANFEESDEEDEFDESAAMPPKGETSRFMRYIEKVKHSKAFQALTDVEPVRRAMENLSDTEIQLTVTVERIAGRLSINLPHPPADKMWWAFVSKPELKVKALPKLGSKEVTIDRLLSWIEAKLTTEIHRLVTIPNMDDITIAVMCSTLDDPEFRREKLTNLILK